MAEFYTIFARKNVTYPVSGVKCPHAYAYKSYWSGSLTRHSRFVYRTYNYNTDNARQIRPLWTHAHAWHSN